MIELPELKPLPIVIDDDQECLRILRESGQEHLLEAQELPAFNQMEVYFRYCGYFWLAVKSYGHSDPVNNGHLLCGLPESVGLETAVRFFAEAVMESSPPGAERVEAEIIK